MVYFAGTASAGSGALNALAIAASLRTQIPTHSNWSLVESTTMNAAAVPCDVYKCSSAGNGLGVDFYFAVMTSGSSIYFGLSEGYNTSTHKPKRPAMGNPAVTAQTLQADGGLMPATTELDWFSGTYNPGGGALNVYGQGMGVTSVQDWALSLAADGLLLTLSAGSTAYAGVYDSLVVTPATNDPVPLLLCTVSNLGVWGAGYWSSTRHPMRGGLSTPWPCAVGGSLNASNVVTALLFNSAWGSSNVYPFVGGITSGTDSGDLYLGGNVPANRIAVHNAYTVNSATAGRDKTGGIRGLAKRLRYLPTSGPAFQDTIVIDGVTYAYASGATAGLWHEKNPA